MKAAVPVNPRVHVTQEVGHGAGGPGFFQQDLDGPEFGLDENPDSLGSQGQAQKQEERQEATEHVCDSSRALAPGLRSWPGS